MGGCAQRWNVPGKALLDPCHGKHRIELSPSGACGQSSLPNCCNAVPRKRNHPEARQPGQMAVWFLGVTMAVMLTMQGLQPGIQTKLPLSSDARDGPRAKAKVS